MLRVQNTLTFLSIVTILGMAHPSWSKAAEQVGTLTQIEGDVKLFTEPSKKLHKDSSDARPRALFEGEYYRVQDVKVGDRVEQGNIVRTAPNGKAKVVFDNGDQFHVGPGTSYRTFWNKDSAQGETKINLVYGKLRGVIAKGGPRSRLQVKTKAATMGVRGTEFFISENPADGETEISIIRGAVEVKPAAAAPTAKAIEVKTGFSATIAATPAPEPQVADAPKAPVAKMEPKKFEPVVELRKTTQEDLIGIQKSSEITAAPGSETAVSKEVATKLEVLEKKAVETTLTDIKTHDPKLFEKLKKEDIKTVAQINAKTVETLIQEAPKAPPRRKPFQSELDSLEQGAYEKYFKIVD